jgi:hypothetical protein
MKLSSDGGDFGSKKCKRSYGGAYGGDWRGLPLFWFLSAMESGAADHAQLLLVFTQKKWVNPDEYL